MDQVVSDLLCNLFEVECVVLLQCSVLVPELQLCATVHNCLPVLFEDQLLVSTAHYCL